MSVADLARGRVEARPWSSSVASGSGLLRGTVLTYLGVIILLPLAALFWRSTGEGIGGFSRALSNPAVQSSLELTLVTSLLVVLINTVTGTILAWVLVRDRFPGQNLVNAIIDLPFALPTVVAGVTLLTLYGPRSPLGLNLAFTRAGVVLGLLFETLPFVVRAVQPVLAELDREAEEAAASLGASSPVIARRIILPSLLPAILSGAGLGFARALGEFGSVVLISGNIPFQTEVVSVRIFNQIESGDTAGAAVLSVVLLALSLIVLLTIASIERWGWLGDR